MEGERIFLDGVEVTKERADKFTKETLNRIGSIGFLGVIEELRRIKYEGDL